MLKIPEHINYIGAFLTLKCNLNCSYCINKHDSHLYRKEAYRRVPGKEWIEGLNKLAPRDDLPVTLQGGEPSLHKDFYEIINGVHHPVDILTNIQFDVEEFMKNVKPERFKYRGKYACIRVSYHPGQMDLADTIDKVLTLQKNGYSIGVFIVKHPAHLLQPEYNAFADAGIDIRWKEFLGYYQGKLYGTYKYKDAVQVSPIQLKSCICSPSEILIDPSLGMHICHQGVYHNTKLYNYLYSVNEPILPTTWMCYEYGLCNPCDIKIKTNRFQEDGHCAVEIKMNK
jgi:hypothetical protein